MSQGPAGGLRIDLVSVLEQYHVIGAMVNHASIAAGVYRGPAQAIEA
jgi:hypothetical protein